MLKDHRAELAAIKRFDQLIRYLRDPMGWPIQGDDFEELTFEYTPEELGIDSKNAAKIQEIKRLRPLSPNQPWGIFFVKFEPKALPVIALRRILSQVALKKRASANSAERAAWAADDLLFVSNYGEGDERRISFAHFSTTQDGHDLPTLKVLGWDSLDTALHLDAVAKELTRHLAWPEDDTDVEAWRKNWRAAFNLRHREVVTTSRDLSIRLAELARAIRDRIKTAVSIETAEGALTKLMKGFQEALVHDLDAEGFADMYAQTIAYGLLSARIADPHKKTADDFAAHMRTNPFLRELMQTFLKVGGRRGRAGGPGIDFDELGVSEVVDLLDGANIEAIVNDFGDRNPREDPVIHFYELFLKEYDARKRLQRGVFYTPRPVVSYIVRSVDELLRREFGLADGLADITSWGEMAAKHKELKIPGEIPPERDFVYILDPATGTGTFLVEVIDLIHKTLVTKWEAQGHRKEAVDALWNEYVPKHLLKRLHGYELLMAPYAISHLKIGLKLYETGYRFGSEERARIYLTNALEPQQEFSGTLAFEVPALAHEAQAVNSIKSRQYFTVVIGNPPYSVSSWNTGAWITDLVEVYKETVRDEESQIQSLSNDYIKFLRLGEWHIERSGIGVFGMITGHGYLHGTQPRDLRNHLSQSFDRCYCLDLHGSIRRTSTGDENDEPVFQIMTGVAVNVSIRVSPHLDRGTTSFTSLTGLLSKKFVFLEQKTAISASAGMGFHMPTPPHFSFAPAASAPNVVAEYHRYVDLPDVFGTGNRQEDKEVHWATGFASQQDELAISFSRAELSAKIEALAASKTFVDLNKVYRLCTTNQWDYKAAKEFARSGSWKEAVRQVAYRPFDRRWTVFDKNILTILRRNVMSQLTDRSKRNLGLISSRAVNDLAYAHCFVTSEPVDKIFISSKTSTNAYVFPLYFYSKDLYGGQTRHNFSPKFLRQLAASLGIETLDARGVPIGLSTESIFHYLYSILHSPAYRNRYEEFLKADFPRLPLARNLDLFRALAKRGEKLVALHLLETPEIEPDENRFIGSRDSEVERISWLNDIVWIDRAQSTGFRGVSESVWKFRVGGYQVCEKWLKDRKGRTLSKEDIIHYQKIVGALSETIQVMKEVDDVIEQHGGWPGAFAQDDGSAQGTAIKTRGASSVVPFVHSNSSAEYQATQPRLLNAAEPQTASYEPLASADVDGMGRTPVELDRQDLICRIRQLFGDGHKRDRETAIDALARELGYQRTEPQIHEELDNALRTAVRRRILASESGVICLFARTIEQYERDFLKEQFLASLQGRQWTVREDAVRSFARWLGFRRTGPAIEDAARSLINGLLREGRIESGGSVIRRSD